MQADFRVFIHARFRELFWEICFNKKLQLVAEFKTCVLQTSIEMESKSTPSFLG